MLYHTDNAASSAGICNSNKHSYGNPISVISVSEKSCNLKNYGTTVNSTDLTNPISCYGFYR